MKTFFTLIGGVVSVAALVIILPFISFWLAYFGGWLCTILIGDTLANGLNSLFNTTHFTKDMIPLCAATLGWIGGYFKCRTTKINTD
jgi:hypothetical protein